MDSQKKLSFSFSKISKPTSVLKSKQEEEKTDVELIDCLEEQSIKIKNPVEQTHMSLVIPLRDDSKDLLDRIKQFRQNKIDSGTNRVDDDRPDSELTLDELAARQLMREAEQGTIPDFEKKIHAVPLAGSNESNQNDKESTLDDYNNVPVGDYGMAMLRGMGWSESTGIGKDNMQVSNVIEPELRPKGMGLGANKIVNRKQELLKACNGQEEELSLVKGSCAKVIAGSNKGNYCKVIALDDESGRIIVEMVIAKTVLPLNEFLLVPVSKEEFSKNSKVLNIAKYEAYTDKSSSPSTSRAGASSDKHRKSKRYDNDGNYQSKKKRKKSKDYDEEKKYKHKKTKKHKRRRSRSKEGGEKTERRSKRNRSSSGRSSDEGNSRRHNSKKERR